MRLVSVKRSLWQRHLQDQRQPCKYRSGHILAVLVQDCLRGDVLVYFYSRQNYTLVTFW